MIAGLKFSSQAWLDYIHWQKNSPDIKRMIDELCLDIAKSPYEGKGYPQPLSYDLKYIWTRRINMVHRLVYQINGDRIEIIQCRLNES
ncbi:Txe/YoeB family addiction module toxin [Reichenbachiella ulvae]|uniref:Putative mRNA interferase YoeB n=1 Tax=Reichenbachiella ulvae TaxID=2980104 RepID=A0ABT3CRE8_9BACT|nr:Txe/YoeB family addiction module toxin [Reichenbachiella ulvae]MCV9385843.1 Txe/YoeB family addiction module toxin [Reichenbachiella ulvae]